MDIVKISYEISGYRKYLTGELISEDSDFFVVRGLRDNRIFEIAKKTVLEIQREVKL